MTTMRAGVAIALAALAAASPPAMTSAAAAGRAAPAPGAAVTPGGTAATRAPARPAGALPPGRSWTVTLLTGDVVRVRTVRGGPPLVSVRPGSGRRGVPFEKDIRPDGTVRVVPLDAAPKIGTVYDPALFDVTALIEDGDDDARRADLPLIVRDGRAAPALAGRRHLAAIGATAVRQPKSAVAALARDVATGAVAHVWLDRRVQVQALDHNLTQIGAPAAWAAGATGKGVRVAVLDTGVDATHPDLKGRIAEQKNFSTSPDTADRFGHGTHVAATIAGTGAAAHGERRGVAPDAHLVIGKVLGDNGGGRESDVIAGMEWAASQARIVSMSLGAFTDDPANDPVAAAADTLTAKDGALFVVAAGNDGPFPDGIETPGVAASALTVGAVDGADKVAAFSSRGGTLMKPEISAPGVDIVAARAAGTAMGHVLDARYTSASGTSMATPHVAGAAADLLQEHPSWPPERLKAALTGTAHRADGTVYDTGAGRLDVGAAARATVFGDRPDATFGTIPHGTTRPVTQRLGWTNTGTGAVTLTLAATIAAPSGTRVAALRVPRTVRVPAGGSAAVTVTLDPRRLTTAGRYGGVVTATAPGVALRVPVGAFAAPETHTLTLRATALPGTPAGALAGDVSVVDLDDRTLFDSGTEIGAGGIATLQVPAGRYAVLGTVADTTPGKERTALTGNGEVTVHGDTTVLLDASRARQVRLTAPGATPSADGVRGVVVERGAGGDIWAVGAETFDGSPVYSTPIARVRTGTLRAEAFARLTDGGRNVYDLMHELGDKVPDGIDYTAAPKDLATIHERYGALDGNTKAPVGEVRYGITPTGFLASEASGSVPGGSTRTDHVSAEPGVRWSDEAVPPALRPGSWVTEVPIRRFAAGRTYTESWVGQPFHPGPYSATAESASFCQPGPTTRARGNIHVELVDLQDLPDGFDCLTDDPEWDAVSSRTMRLYAGGRLAGTSTHSYGDFSVPATAGTYRLVYDLDASKALPVSTRTSTTWTFRSRPGEERVPLLTVGYALPLNLLNRPDGDRATFTVARVKGAAAARATGLALWTSLDDGATWRAVPVTRAPGGRYTATLPHAGRGQAVSLRVRATDSGGGAIDQTIIRAYSGA